MKYPTRIKRFQNVVVAALAMGLVFAFAGAAHAATFQNASPPSGEIRPLTQNVQFSVDVTATPGQTLASAAALAVDDGPPTTVYVSYTVDHWEWYVDGEYGEEYWIPVYDYSQGTVSGWALLPSSLAQHTASVTVTESSGLRYSYTWSFPGENCKDCHDDYPAAHTAAAMSTCAPCHADNGQTTVREGPVALHNGSLPGGCSSCHGIGSAGHGAGKLLAHTYYDLDDNPYPREESTCSRCHTGGYAGITQISGAHGGDPTAKHAAMWDPECSNTCHGGGDAAAIHPSCETCHPEGGPGPAPGSTCKTCHVTYHDKAVSTPASSPWSVALLAGAALCGVDISRRLRTST